MEKKTFHYKNGVFSCKKRGDSKRDGERCHLKRKKKKNEKKKNSNQGNKKDKRIIDLGCSKKKVSSYEV